MDFDASLYDETNNLQYKTGEELINKIKEENYDNELDIVLDIGCGTGNVTLLLNSLLTINQLYAIDVNKEIIKFAENKYKKNNIHYLLQDVSLQWDQLRPEIKALEGKASVVFTNYALHWVIDKENVTKNLFRLLSKSGKLYAHFLWIFDPFDELKGQEKENHEKEILKIPTKEEQMNLWINIFKTVGFDIIENEFLSRRDVYEKQIFNRVFLPLEMQLRKQYFIEKNELKRNEVMNKTSVDMFRRISAKTRKFTDESNGKEMIEFEDGIFRFILQKSSN